jgi:hypothetical protein
MLPTGVIGVIAVGVDGRAVISAKARVPFLARLTGQGVESGDTNPVTAKYHIAVPAGHPGLVAVSVMVNAPGLVGVPEMVPVLGFIDKPWGRKLAVKVAPLLWFVLGVSENGAPVAIESLK